jgi:hypothetical protein
MVMVNLEVYKAYSDQHLQRLMQSARQNRDLNQMKMHQCEKDETPSGLVNWLLVRLTQSSSGLTEKAGSIIESSSDLLPE